MADNPFAIQPEGPGFEALAQENGFRFWWASDLATMLGYADLGSFRKAISKAMQVCIQLGVNVTDNVVPVSRSVAGRVQEDYKLSRFACYLAAMNGDVRKPEVAYAQAYFITFAEGCRLALAEAEGVERISTRGEIKDREKTLGSAARDAGVTEFALFQNAGYRGLYNMHYSELKQLKNVPAKRSPLDFMGSTELAANLFRITQTEQKIRNSNLQGQAECEDAAFAAGRTVRKAMYEISGQKPEDLPAAPDLRGVEKQVKSTQRAFKKLDKSAPKVPSLPQAAETSDEAETE